MLVKDAAREAAEKVLSDRWDGTFPVDPVRMAQDFGIKVTPAVFKEESISGAIIANGRESVTIFTNAYEGADRQMFTAAHELGHFLERESQGDTDYSFVERRGAEYNLHEFYADEFAGNLLMPASAFASMWESTRSVSAVADYFGVSFGAAQHRLGRLRKYGVIA